MAEQRATGNPAVLSARPRQPWLLGREFFSNKSKYRLRNEGDLIESRKAHDGSGFNNLDHLLRSRYGWMHEFVRHREAVVEIGAGAGFSSRYLQRKIILTDVVANDWLDLAMDGTAFAFRDESVDVIIISNALHHFAHPAIFFIEASRVLKNGGLILMNDAYCSLLLRLILRVAHHEGYSYNVDVFDSESVANDPKDPWSGNNAVSNLFFDSRELFETIFPCLRILSDTPCESLSFIASGGVTAKLPVPTLPTRVLDAIAWLDGIVVKAAPDLFALSRRTIIEKVKPAEPARTGGSAIG